jgi:UDP:flavonoid glycosyltransferase YjiC (YdhE family)
MRVLFTCHPALGHFLPLTPIARAVAEAGHEVAFAAPRFLRPAVEAADFRWMRAGVEDDDPDLVAADAELRTLRGPEASVFTHERIMVGIRARRLVPDLLALAEAWRPDLFVRDCSEFGALAAAELLGVPHAKVEVHAPGQPPRFTAALVGPLRRLRAEFGLPEYPLPDLLGRYLVLVPFPPGLNTVGTPIPPTAHHLRALPPDDPDAELPAWMDELGPRPVIYVGLGTLFSEHRGLEIFAKLLAGLRDVDAEVVATTGHGLDPAALGPQPGHVHIERFLPLGAVLARCSLVVFHGGSGTLIRALARGLPMASLPLGADQPENAIRGAELGFARALDQGHLAPEHIRVVILDVLQTPSYRRGAERVRDEIERLPGVELAVELLERLARDRAPIIAPR